MSQATLAGSPRGQDGEDLRRSSRLERQVPLLISGHDGVGQEFLEQTTVVSLNLHGCRYPSRHECAVGSWVTLQITGNPLVEKGRNVRAQVKSVHPPPNPREMFQVGVELEAPGNVWGISPTPLDWRSLLGTMPFGVHTAANSGPARSSVMEMPVAGRPTVVPAPESAGETTSTSSAQDAAQVFPLRPEGEAATRQRVVVSPERLIEALQSKLRASADAAVQSAISRHLEPAMTRALASIEEKHSACVRSLLETLT